MSKEQKTMWFTGMYRGFMSLSVLVLIFQGGEWKRDIESKAFESPKEKYELIERVDRIEQNQKEFYADFKKQLLRIEMKLE